ncbi:MAG: hypothetical protein ACRD7E_27765 [Bryobacteraceae bacterium]
MSTVILALLLLSLVACLFGLVFRRLASPSMVAECDPAWLSEFSVAKYRPMLRLLAEEDYGFLSEQVGYQSKISRKLRAERRKIFRAYLRNLTADFHRLHLSARMMLVYAPDDRPEVAAALMKQRMLFVAAVLSVEARLALHAIGIGTVDVRNLVGSLESLRASVGQLAPAQQFSA